MARSVQIIGVPTDLGANMRGANIGPAAIRIAGLFEKIKLLGLEVEDIGDLMVPVRETISKDMEAQHYLKPIAAICETLCKQVEATLQKNKMPIVLGGDHCVAMGTITGVSEFYRRQNKKIGMIWVDAHADINTPSTSQSLNIHGMPLSVVLGHGYPELVKIGGGSPVRLDPANVALIGIRMLDGPEKELVRKSGIRYFTMREIDERGMAPVMKEAIEVTSRGTVGIHLSFDLDGVDPLYAPGVSTPVTGGLSYREAHLMLEMLADTGKLLSMEFVEYNAIQDIAHKTALLVTEFIQSALGKSIV